MTQSNARREWKRGHGSNAMAQQYYRNDCYFGKRTTAGVIVVVHDDGPRLIGRYVPLRKDLYFHADAFDWGERFDRDTSEGSLQLALALLAHDAGDELALDLRHDFARDVVSQFGERGWSLLGWVVEEWVAEKLAGRRG